MDTSTLTWSLHVCRWNISSTETALPDAYTARLHRSDVDALTLEYPNATVVLAGDFIGLDDAELSTHSMLTANMNQPTRGTNVLDKIYVNDASYDAVKVVTPTMRSDHKAVIAYTSAPPRQLNKTRGQRVFRCRSPSQHALFLQHAPAVTFEFHDGASIHSKFDVMYTIMHELLDRFYPERQVTVTSADPRYITCLLYTSPSPRDGLLSRMPSSA